MNVFVNFNKYHFNAAQLPPEGRMAILRRRFHIWTHHHPVALMGNQQDGYWYVPRAWRNHFRRFPQLRGLAPYVSEHVVLVFDRKRERVHRLSLDELGNERIEKNAQFLRQTHSISRPFSHRLVNKGRLYYSTEALVDGAVMRAGGMSAGEIDSIVEAISPLYETDCKKRHFRPKDVVGRYKELSVPVSCQGLVTELSQLVYTRTEPWRGQSLVWSTIHGDLVHRNIIKQSDGNYVFIDGDRSEYLFPEIDIMLLVLFWDVHRSREQTRTLIPFINHAVNILELAQPHLDRFYKSQPVFRSNQPHAKLFQILLTYRIAMFGAHNFNHPSDQANAKRLLKAAISAIERM